MIQVDIDMPKRCEECPLCVDYDCIIHERVTDEYYDTTSEQYAHCPLTMPSAQPDLQQTCNNLATDSISIEKLLTFYERRAKELKGVYGDLGGACNGVAKSIKLLTAQPER